MILVSLIFTVPFIIFLSRIIVYDECEIDICLNGGTCRILAGDYLCFCAEGYAGLFCEISGI